MMSHKELDLLLVVKGGNGKFLRQYTRMLLLSIAEKASLDVISRCLKMLLILASVICFSRADNHVSYYTKDKLKQQLPLLNLALGDKVLIRTFKKESQLELWLKPQKKSQYILFKTYPICYYSGGLGPKQYQGDKITPEGFYHINRKGLNANTRFHFSLDIGYPNAYDRARGRTGSLIMIHGACDSIGCFAMGNDQVEEIYFLIFNALKNGQKAIPVHAFPFHLSKENMMRYRANQWYPFWQQLKPAYDGFNSTHIAPIITVKKGQYHIVN